jgi:predicted ATPase
VYQRGREVLVEELGVDPSPELQRLHQAILVQDPALDGPDRAPAPPPSNLPDRLTTFVGREPELAELAGLVEWHRLVTVTGPGGVGKTSLAVEEARRLADRFPDGVWLVELAGLADPALLAEVVVAALGLGEEAPGAGGPPPAPVDRLAGFVADKALLVVLDNCEHLVAACAGLIRRLLEAGPAVRVLATSREVLGVPGEAVWPLPPLAVPDPAGLDLDAPADPDAELAPEALGRFDAVRLFCERAATANPGFVLDASNAAAVAEITARLDGLPLAIELAAARVRALPPAELAARLEDRFRLLTAGGRTVAARHQTLRATIDWSWELLEGPDRRLWRRLSVFSGGFTLPAAEAVCGGDGLDPAGVLEGLVGLVDRSVVVAVGGSPARFGLLESLRAYGAERLAEAGEAEAVADRHTAFFLDLAEQGGHGYDQRWLRRVAGEDDNLRAVLDRAMAAPDPDTALRLAGALGRYWAAEHHDEGRRRLEAALALAAGQPPTPGWPGPSRRWPGWTCCSARPRPRWRPPGAASSCSSASGTSTRPPSPSCSPGRPSSSPVAAATGPGCSRRPRRPWGPSATAGARPTRVGPGSPSSPTSESRPGPSPWPSRPWRGSGPSATSGRGPRCCSSSARRPASPAGSRRPPTGTRTPWPPPARPARTGSAARP